MKDRLGQILYRWRIRTVLPHISGKLLDVGCGMNSLVRSYSGEGIGVDAYQWGNVDTIVSDSADLPYDNGSFNTVTIIAALNHIPNRTDVLREVHRVLDDKGIVIITMIPPGISKVWHTIRKPWDNDQYERGMKKGEVYGLTSGETSALLTRSGFTVRLIRRFMFGINCMTIAGKKHSSR